MNLRCASCEKYTHLTHYTFYPRSEGDTFPEKKNDYFGFREKLLPKTSEIPVVENACLAACEGNGRSSIRYQLLISKKAQESWKNKIGIYFNRAEPYVSGLTFKILAMTIFKIYLMMMKTLKARIWRSRTRRS